MSETFNPASLLWELRQYRKTAMLLVIVCGFMMTFAVVVAILLIAEGSGYVGLVVGASVVLVLMFVWSLFYYRGARRSELKLVADIETMLQRRAQRDD